MYLFIETLSKLVKMRNLATVFNVSYHFYFIF